MAPQVPPQQKLFPTLCLKGNSGSEENHPAPQHLGEVFLTPGLCTSLTLCFLLCFHHKEPLTSTSRDLGSLSKGSWHKAGLEGQVCPNSWITAEFGWEEVWSSLLHPAQRRKNLKFVHLVAHGQNQVNSEHLQGSPSMGCSVWSLPWWCQNPLRF